MKINDDIEIWKEHPTFTNYEGSNFGRIRVKNTKKIKKQILLKTSNRYLIPLSKEGKKYVKYSHRFICECFYGINKSLTVDHIDSNPQNNNISNLRYLPFVENTNNPNSKRKRVPAKTTSKAEKVKCLDLDGNLIGLFETAKEAVIVLKLSKSKRASNYITDACKGIRNKAYGYKWEYINEEPLPNEIFKKHPTLDVEVSNFGRIRRTFFDRYKITKGTKNGNGYFKVVINKKGYFVHRLVAETFIPNQYNKLEVNHKNSNTEDNTVENLEWVSRSENMLSDITHSKRAHKVDLYGLDGNFLESFSSLTQMCSKRGLDIKSVRKCLNGKFKQHHGYTFKYHKK